VIYFLLLLKNVGLSHKKGFTQRSGETRRKRGVSIKKNRRVSPRSLRRRVRLCCICSFMRKPC
jgi:hypothetical protein